MVAAGYIIEILFGMVGLIPTERDAQVVDASISWNCTSFLNIAFLLLRPLLSSASCAPTVSRCCA